MICSFFPLWFESASATHFVDSTETTTIPMHVRGITITSTTATQCTTTTTTTQQQQRQQQQQQWLKHKPKRAVSTATSKRRATTTKLKQLFGFHDFSRPNQQQQHLKQKEQQQCEYTHTCGGFVLLIHCPSFFHHFVFMFPFNSCVKGSGRSSMNGVTALSLTGMGSTILYK